MTIYFDLKYSKSVFMCHRPCWQGSEARNWGIVSDTQELIGVWGWGGRDTFLEVESDPSGQQISATQHSSDIINLLFEVSRIEKTYTTLCLL